ncbi:MAG: sialidase family protein [Kiritimatiellaeota bacterium]|nr:sialidase family protein [Kiritimatiellota bacterium]
MVKYGILTLLVCIVALVVFKKEIGLSTWQSKQAPYIIDKEVRYYKGPPDQSLVARPAPIPASQATALPPLPKRIKVPYAAEEENVYSYNVYREPDKPWILHLAVVTKFIDDTNEAVNDYKIWYRVSNDGGNTFASLHPLIQSGKDYDFKHPIRPVWAGKNGFFSCISVPVVRASNGEIMATFTLTSLDENGKIYNPSKCSSFTAAGVLIGRWADGGQDIIWDFGQTVMLSPEQSTRGAMEPTVIELSQKGEFLMLLRASNDWGIFDEKGKWVGSHKSDQDFQLLPGHKWVSYSRDYCRTWSKPVPFGYADGAAFFSPSSCSTVLRSIKNGRLYWIGNICPENPAANDPRYPLVIGEIDEVKKGIKKDSLLVIDTRDPQYDSNKMQLSNFKVYEDPANGNLLVVLQRLEPVVGPWGDWTSGGHGSWYLVGVPYGRFFRVFRGVSHWLSCSTGA